MQITKYICKLSLLLVLVATVNSSMRQHKEERKNLSKTIQSGGKCKPALFFDSLLGDCGRGYQCDEKELKCLVEPKEVCAENLHKTRLACITGYECLKTFKRGELMTCEKILFTYPKKNKRFKK